MFSTASATQDHIARASNVGFAWAFDLGVWAMIFGALLLI